MIRFDKLIIEGFASIVKPLTFNLDARGLNVIRGDNGVGKTTIMNALFWAISQESLKKKSSIETWEFLREEDYPGVKVELTYFDTIKKDSYKLIRMKNYKKRVEGARGGNRVLLYKNGELSNKDGKKDIQNEIQKSLNNITPRVMKNSIFFGQRVSRLTSETPTERKRILDDIFDFKFIDESKENVDKKIKSLIEDINQLDKKIFEYNSTLNSIKENIQISDNLINNLEKNNKEKINNIKLLVKSLESKLKTFSDKLESKKKDIEKPKELKMKELENLSGLKVEVKFLNDSLKNLNKEKLKLKMSLDEIEDVCPTCGTPYNEKSIKQARDSAKKSIKEVEEKIQVEESRKTLLEKRFKKVKEKNEEIQTINDKLSSKYSSQLNDYEVKLREVRKLNNEITIIKSKISDKKEEIKNSKIPSKQIEEIELKIKAFKIKAKEKKIRLKSLMREKKSLNIKKRRYDWLSKVFSNNGFKSFLYDMKVELINEFLEYYAMSSGFSVRLEIGDNIKKDINIKVFIEDNEVNIADLSGGQTQLIDLALVFSIHDVLSDNFNFIWLDEAFESLDSKNIPKVNDLIESKIKNKTDFSCFITTHLSNYNPVGSKVIQVKESGKYTELS